MTTHRSIEDEVIDEDIAFLRSMGENDEHIARRLGLSVTAVEMRDLARDRRQRR